MSDDQVTAPELFTIAHAALDLTQDEERELMRLKAYFPYRQCFAVKSARGCSMYDTKRKAYAAARREYPAAVYGAQ